MLKGIHPRLTADLLRALASMGHGDGIAIVRIGELRPCGNIVLAEGVVNRCELAP